MNLRWIRGKLCYVSCIFCHRNYKYFYTRIMSRDNARQKSSIKYRKLLLEVCTEFVKTKRALQVSKEGIASRNQSIRNTRIINNFNFYYNDFISLSSINFVITFFPLCKIFHIVYVMYKTCHLGLISIAHIYFLRECSIAFLGKYY